jgi:phage tail protein X
MIVRARQGDTLDAVCWRHLKRTDIVVQVLELNPTLAEIGAVLPEGTLVTLPDAVTTANTKKLTQLWD